MVEMVLTTRRHSTLDHNPHIHHHENLILILTRKFVFDLGNYLRWGKHIVLCLLLVTSLFQFKNILG